MNPNRIHVLILDDIPDDAELTALKLREEGFDFEWQLVGKEAEFLAVLYSATDFDLILSDYTMPGFSGMRALELLKQRAIDIPFILLSGTIGEEVAVEAMKHGAYDYLLKGKLTRLGPSIRNALAEKRLRDENREAERALQASERRFRALVERSTDGIALLDASGVALYQSPAAERIYGVKPEDLIGTNTFDTLHPDDVATANILFGQLLSEPGASLTSTMRFRHVDGSWRWVEATGTNLLQEPSVQAIVVNYRDVTERKLAEVEITRRLAELEAVNRISTALRAAQTLEEMLPLLMNTLVQSLGLQDAALWLYDAPAGELYTAVTVNWPGSARERPGQGIAGQVFLTGQVEMSPDFKADLRIPEALRANLPDNHGGANLPIRTAQEIIGVLSVGVHLPQQITPNELRLLTTIAEIAGNAIHRTRLNRQTEQRLERISALHSIDSAISNSFDLQFTLSVILEQVIGQLRVDAADILLLDPRAHTLEHAAGRGFRSGNPGRAPIRLGDNDAGRAAMDRRLVSIPDLGTQGIVFSRPQMASSEGFVTYYAVPLISKGQVNGVLEVFIRQPLKPDADWIDFLETLAGQAAIAIDDANLFNNLQRSNVELTLAYDATIEGWSHALDLRDHETEGHTRRVTETTLNLARAMGFHEAELVHIRRGALLHDIGKMGVPDSILLKPGKLTEDEWEIMRKHTTYAYEMLSPIDYLQPALEIPYSHHEKWDGSGYPRGLRGDQIPLSARLFAVVDVWDALRSDRPYRPGWPEQDVLHYIMDESGKHFDPAAVQAFMALDKRS